VRIHIYVHTDLSEAENDAVGGRVVAVAVAPDGGHLAVVVKQGQPQVPAHRRNSGPGVNVMNTFLAIFCEKLCAFSFKSCCNPFSA
jgi:hypothetical protein